MEKQLQLSIINGLYYILCVCYLYHEYLYKYILNNYILINIFSFLISKIRYYHKKVSMEKRTKHFAKWKEEYDPSLLDFHEIIMYTTYREITIPSIEYQLMMKAFNKIYF